MAGGDGPRHNHRIRTRHRDIQVLWAASGDGTGEAAAAAGALGPANRVQVLGTDISPTLERRLGDQAGILLAVTAQQPEEIGYRVASTPFGAKTYAGCRTASLCIGDVRKGGEIAVIKPSGSSRTCYPSTGRK